MRSLAEPASPSLTVGIAVVTAVLAGALSLGLIRTSGDDAARRSLARLADVTQSAVANPAAAPAGWLAHWPVSTCALPSSDPTAASPRRTQLVRTAVTPADMTSVLAGRNVSATRSVGGVQVFLEARPAGTGGDRPRPARRSTRLPRTASPAADRDRAA